MTYRDYYLFTLFLILWIVLSWSISLRDLAGGAVFSAAAVFIMRPMGTARAGKSNESMVRRAVEVVIFAAVVLGDLVVTSVRLIARCFSRGQQETSRRLITVSLRDEAALTLLALSITLTTDAAVIDTDRASRQIDCMMMNEPGGIERTERIIRRYEKILSKVFD